MERSQRPERRSSFSASALWLISLLAFALRAYRIDWQSLWVDENFTVLLSSKDLASITHITSVDVHPPLYYYLVHFWMMIVGQSEYSLRFLSLFFGLLLVPLTYKLGSLLLGRRVGLLAAFLTAVAPFQVYYAQEARMYSLLTLLGLLSIYAMVRVAGLGTPASPDSPANMGNRWHWVTLILASAALLYAHYFGVLILVFQSSLLILTRARRLGLLLRWVGSQVLVLALFAPWIPVMMHTYVANDEDWRRHVPFIPMFGETMVSLSLGRSQDETLYLILASGFFVALAVGLIVLALRRGARHLSLLLGLYLFQPIVLTYIVSMNKPVYGASRYLIFVAPAFFLLIAVGLDAMRQRWKFLFASALVLLVMVSGYALSNAYFNEAFAKEDYRNLARTIESKASPEDGLVVINGLVFDYYYRGLSPRILIPTQYPINQEQAVEELNRFSQGKSRLWLLSWEQNALDPDNFILHQLEDHAEVLEAGRLRSLRYTLFKVDPGTTFGANIQRPVEASFEGKVSAVGYSLGTEKPVAGRALEVVLYLKASARLDRDYKLSLLLTDSQGYKWLQQDRSPTAYSMSRWRVGELVEARFRLDTPIGMPPGEYTLSAVMYSPDTLNPVTVVDSKMNALGTRLNLGNVRVERGPLPHDTGGVSPSYVVGQEVAPGMFLMGYDISAGEVDQGDAVTLVLYWQARSQPVEDQKVVVKLLDHGGNSVQQYIGGPHDGRYSTLDWREGEIIRDVHTLRIGAGAPPGSSTLQVSVDPGGSRPAGIGSLIVKEKLRSFSLPDVPNPREEHLGGKIAFRGYGLETSEAHPGGKIGLTLYWQALAGDLESYTVFAHVLDGGNHVWGQHDGQPVDGMQPTSGWLEGQVVTDSHRFAIKPDAPPGEYVVEIGIYDPATGARLKLPNGEDRILLEKLELRGQASP